MFAYGTNSLILALFFAELKFSDYRIGLFMTLTLLGDVFLGLLLTLIADRFGRRKILFGGSFLMVMTDLIVVIPFLSTPASSAFFVLLCVYVPSWFKKVSLPAGG